MNILKEHIEEWIKPFVACLIGMNVGLDLPHLLTASKTALVALLISIVIKKVKNA